MQICQQKYQSRAVKVQTLLLIFSSPCTLRGESKDRTAVAAARASAVTVGFGPALFGPSGGDFCKQQAFLWVRPIRHPESHRVTLQCCVYLLSHQI